MFFLTTTCKNWGWNHHLAIVDEVCIHPSGGDHLIFSRWYQIWWPTRMVVERWHEFLHAFDKSRFVRVLCTNRIGFYICTRVVHKRLSKQKVRKEVFCHWWILSVLWYVDFPTDIYIYIIVYLHLRIQSDPSSQCPFSKGCRLLPCYAGYLDNPHVAASVSGLRVFVIHRKPQPMVGKHRKKTTVKVHHLASSYGVSQHLASSRIIQQRFVAGTVFTTIASNKRTNKSYT